MSYSNGLGNLQQLIGSLATNGTQNTKAPEKNEVSAGGNGTSHVAGISSIDSAQVSGSSSLFNAAVSGSDVRTGKVASLQQSIADGTYNVSASDVASSIIASLIG